MIRNFTLSLLFSIISINAFSQVDLKNGWHLLSHRKDSVYGIELNDAYSFLQKHKLTPIPVIVAVMDSGVDTTQEDLKNILWMNPKELPGNGKDDDKNGFTDDIHGWNFLGSTTGTNLNKAGEEKVRIYHAFKDSFINKEWKDTLTMGTKEKYVYKSWRRAATSLDIKPEDFSKFEMLDASVKAIKRINKTITEELDTTEFTIAYLEKHDTKTKEGKEAKNAYLEITKLLGIESEEKNTTTINELDDYLDKKRAEIEGKENKPENVRKNIINDDYSNIKDNHYGNNDVSGPDPMHGTHVAGIIAAQRHNGIGIDGVADDVRIMIVRVVPDGDEYDKDIANGIFYAVNNGARVINMSFGKEYSPERYWVDSAIRYAAKKDVLIIHSAGNDAENLDTIPSYPMPYSEFYNNTADNIITVGASSSEGYGSGSIIADFSNYGQLTVDVLAPGVKIYSTLPIKNKYGNLNGTSMSAPVVSGVAALIRSYFPTLSYKQVKESILKTVTIPEVNAVNFQPGNPEVKVTLDKMCSSAGIINAAKAIEYAYQISLKSKK